MSNSVTPRQQQILNLLIKHREGMSLNDIATELDISRTAVQQHFASLERDGFVRQGSQQKTAGRPARYYQLTEAGNNLFPKQYSWFSELLLNSLKQKMGPTEFRQYMHQLGLEVAESLKQKVEGKSIEERMEILIDILQNLGYDASAIASPDNRQEMPKLQAHNCVYHDLAQQHNEICEFDNALVSSLLNTEIELEECIAKGGCSCRFKILDKHDNNH